ncbi:phosphatidate cytidylyltransferase [Sphingobacterium olei]|uniref:Phosphatidate cytidylyltransferase n=1 Tax=Sphingobacterium olei TaxID=2571155 RepID=A0A4U0P4B8_9SPHI|nr:phosphatidate cytidylyltransferase [Sphingobacterium olei]TJZ62197.1 phosphatidate cytidylyltransferase [Sphingobacterium olei]
MLWTLSYIIFLFFSIGAAATVRLNKRSDAEQSGARWVKYTFYLIVVIITIWCIWVGFTRYLAVGLLAIGAYEIISGWRASRRNAPFGIVSIIIYLAIAFGFYRFSSQSSSEHVLYVYTIVFTFDGFAQLTGQLFGKRKILPRISPDKTVAGVAGGYVMGAVVGFFVLRWLHMEGYATLFLPILICTGAFAGDVLASWYKRRCGLKDYSTLIPGHGGILDRYDSFIFAGAIFWLFYTHLPI